MFISDYETVYTKFDGIDIGTWIVTGAAFFLL